MINAEPGRRVGRAFLRAAAALALAVLLLFLALPPQQFGPLILVALVPLLIGLARARWIVGLAAGPVVMGAFALIYTLGFTPRILERPLPGGAMVLCVIFGCTLGLPFAAAAGGVRTLRRVFIVSAVAVCAEGLLLWTVPAHLALALAREPLALAVAAVGSIWAVTFLVWWTNASLAAWRLTRERRFVCAAAAPIALAGLLQGVRLVGAPASADAADLVAIQTNETLALPAWRDLHLAASRADGDVAPDLVVWPELSATFLAPGGSDRLLRGLAAHPDAAPFVTTFPTPGPDPERDFNTAVVFSADGVSAPYHKRHPYADEATFHAPGEAAVTVSCGGLYYGLAICFDSCFPATMRDCARTGTADDPAARPDVILLPTLDPPDHTGLIQAMHAASTPFRAAETGRPIVRADITAASMIVGPDGAILVEAPPGETVIRARTPLARRDPPALFVGDGVLYACVVAVGVAAVVRRRQRTEERIPAAAPT